MEEPDLMGEVIAAHRDRGFRAFKIGPFGRRESTKLDEAIVREAREAAGLDAQLFVDAGACDANWPQGLKWALNTAQMLKDYDVGWFEEPLRADAIEDFCTLRRASPVPIAGGEVLTRRQSFLPWLARGALDIIQPDVTKVGGISEQRRIAWLADEFGVKYVGHGWNTASGSPRTCSSPPQCLTVTSSSSSAVVRMLTASSRSHSRSTMKVSCTSQKNPV